MMFYKRDRDGSIWHGPTVYAPTFTLDSRSTEPADGWNWYPTPEEAQAALKATDLEWLDFRGELTIDKAIELTKEQLAKDREEATKPIAEVVKG